MCVVEKMSRVQRLRTYDILIYTSQLYASVWAMWYIFLILGEILRLCYLGILKKDQVQNICYQEQYSYSTFPIYIKVLLNRTGYIQSGKFSSYFCLVFRLTLMPFLNCFEMLYLLTKCSLSHVY